MARTKVRTENHITVDSNINFNNTHRIINLPQPINDNDAASKIYVDSLAQGFKIKEPCRVATSSNIDLNDADMVDGVELLIGDRVLVKNQDDKSQNGVYEFWMDEEPLRRTADFDDWNEINNAFIFIREGTLAGTGWICTVEPGGQVDSDPIEFFQFSSGTSYTAGNGIILSGKIISVKRNSSSALVFDQNGGLKVDTDESTIETNNNALRVKNSGIQASHINNNAVTSDKIAPGSVIESKLGNGAVTKDKLAANVAGNGLIGGVGASLEVGAGTGIVVNENAVSVDSSLVLLFSKLIKQEFVVAPEPLQYVSLSYLPVNTNFMFVFYTGLLLSEGVSNDYVLVNNVITFNFPVKRGDKIVVYYIRS